MLIVKGIYDEGQVKLLEPLRVKGRHIVEIRFIEGEFSKERQLNAFRKARGIWKDCPEVDSIFRELDKRWQEWRENLEGSA